jgi:(E)-4-hydroxy-3-methylbut-2-enyl-diphosphate synthase
MKTLKETYTVDVSGVKIGGSNPVRIQSMTDTDSSNIKETVKQILLLYKAGSELIRLTIDNEDSAKNFSEIKKIVRDKGCDAPLIGDFHYNGHILLKKFPDCAKKLDKYRINPGNVGKKGAKTKNFYQILDIAKEFEKPIRIGVNSGSVDGDVIERLKENGIKDEMIIQEAMILSCLDSLNLALDYGIKKEKIILSCKTQSPKELIYIYRKLRQQCLQPLHLGLTEAGGGIKGSVWSVVPLAILLNEGIGETIRISITPFPGGDRRDEVYIAKELLESLNLRYFSPKIISCPGCGRTSSDLYRKLAKEIDDFIKENEHIWIKDYVGVEKMRVAVMGCIVNGPGESKNADIGISLPGKGENPQSLIFEKGKQVAVLKGSLQELAIEMKKRIKSFVEREYPFKGEKDGKRPKRKN